MTNFFLTGLGALPIITDAKTRSISPENPTGKPGTGGMATEGTGACKAKHLGSGWKISPYYEIKPHAEKVLAEIEGSAVIQSMWFASGMSRQTILRIYWDNQQNPSVECPLTEFFAYSWHKSSQKWNASPFFQLNSVPVAVNPNRGFNCFWQMPFKKHCKITLENRSENTYQCYYQINYSLQQVPEDVGYFHAYFRRTRIVPYKEPHILIDGITGKGLYVGTALFVGLNGAANWWGEGEIKFYIDDDTEYPTICGTGTEDYFGGAYDWDIDGTYQLYTGPFMGMHQLIQCDGLYESQQRFSLYRWHIMDPIRFEKKLKITLQDLGWVVPGEKYLARQDDMASVAYWYQTLPTVPYGEFPPDEEIMFI